MNSKNGSPRRLKPPRDDGDKPLQSLTVHLNQRNLMFVQPQNMGRDILRKPFNTSKTQILAASALMIFAGYMAHTPALAQGIVPGSTATAPRATPQGTTARGIKDKGVSGCGNCGLTGRVKSEGGKTQGKAKNAQ